MTHRQYIVVDLISGLSVCISLLPELSALKPLHLQRIFRASRLAVFTALLALLLAVVIQS